jgi:2-keto-4-pentenoate hydratase/2-oxohepta-3-ene-1,7-dioic acid hydratase in catechol pathway
MRLATFIPPGDATPRAGAVRDGLVVAFADETTTVHSVLAAGGAAPADGESFALDQVKLLAPIPEPRAIFAIGLNYDDHIAEAAGAIGQGERKRPEWPIVFLKLPSSAAPPNDPVRCPAVVKRLDYEGELTIVIGRDGAVGGYTVADDVSARDLQRREPQWTRAKGADGFCPYGPWITTADEVDDPGELSLRTWVNGELRQDSSTKHLIFKIDELVSFISQTCTLFPGDLILTGTPAGVGMAMDPPRFLQSGDVVKIEIEQLGSIEHGIA